MKRVWRLPFTTKKSILKIWIEVSMLNRNHYYSIKLNVKRASKHVTLYASLWIVHDFKTIYWGLVHVSRDSWVGQIALKNVGMVLYITKWTNLGLNVKCLENGNGLLREFMPRTNVSNQNSNVRERTRA